MGACSDFKLIFDLKNIYKISIFFVYSKSTIRIINYHKRWSSFTFENDFSLRFIGPLDRDSSKLFDNEIVH